MGLSRVLCEVAVKSAVSLYGNHFRIRVLLPCQPSGEGQGQSRWAAHLLTQCPTPVLQRTAPLVGYHERWTPSAAVLSVTWVTKLMSQPACGQPTCPTAVSPWAACQGRGAGGEQELCAQAKKIPTRFFCIAVTDCCLPAALIGLLELCNCQMKCAN